MERERGGRERRKKEGREKTEQGWGSWRNRKGREEETGKLRCPRSTSLLHPQGYKCWSLGSIPIVTVAFF